jgi:hypothetical protein
MKLKGDSGNAFELIILRYQFPDVHEDRWDSNWLEVSGKVTTGEQSWRFSDPAVTTFELADLADWLEAVALGDAHDDEFEFTEPNLAFFVVRTPAPTLRVRFAHESAPPWIEAHDERMAGVLVDFPLAETDLALAANDLRNALIEFPMRGGAA